MTISKYTVKIDLKEIQARKPSFRGRELVDLHGFRFVSPFYLEQYENTRLVQAYSARKPNLDELAGDRDEGIQRWWM